MFTGIVEGVGVVRTAEQRGDVLVARVDVGGLFEGLPLGGSVAVNGCCLTAVESDAEGFTVELTGETLKRTRFDERLQPGARINLERPMKADGRFDGHVVQGHVDGIGTVKEMKSLGESSEIRIEVPRRARPLSGREGLDHRGRHLADRVRPARRRVLRRPHPVYS